MKKDGPLIYFILKPNRALAVLSIFLAVAGVGGIGCGSGISDEELKRRTEASQPTWPNYEEDIKAQIGAGPVAEWEGRPVEAHVYGDSVEVTFRVMGPWAQRITAIPVLLREPTGAIHRNVRTTTGNGQVIYAFSLPAQTSVPAWLELKFPHGEKRLVLSPSGVWHENP